MRAGTEADDAEEGRVGDRVGISGVEIGATGEEVAKGEEGIKGEEAIKGEEGLAPSGSSSLSTSFSSSALSAAGTSEETLEATKR